ncbi:MAG: tetratricopeptide repeat protein, partial [Proteobacteria bacterium]|nr:tetratricopeptide repeat protein [Pseudomonadota bacterium]
MKPRLSPARGQWSIAALVVLIFLFAQPAMAQPVDPGADLDAELAQLFELQRLTDAEKLARKQLRLRKEAFGDTHILVATSTDTVASLLYYQGDFDKAWVLYHQAQSIRDQLLEPNDPVHLAGLGNLAQFAMAREDGESAAELYGRVLDLHEQSTDLSEMGQYASQIALQLQGLGHPKGAEVFFRRSMGYFEAVVGPDHPQVAVILSNLISLLVNAEKPSEALPLAQRALAIDEAMYGSESNDVAIDLVNLGVVLTALGKWDDAQQSLERAVSIGETLSGTDHPDVAGSLDHLGSLLTQRGELPAAKTIQERILSIREAHPEDQDSLVVALLNLAHVLDKLGQYDEARPLYDRALTLKEAKYGLDDPEVAGTLNNLATHLDDRGKYDEARALLERAIVIQETNQPDSLALATVLNNLGLVQLNQGAYLAAKSTLERGLAIEEGLLGPEDVRLTPTLNNLGIVLENLGDFYGAETLYQRVLETREAWYGPDHIEVSDALATGAAYLEKLGGFSRAKLMLERALTIREAATGKEHPQYAGLLNNYAFVLYKLGDYLRARPIYEECIAIQEKVLGPEHPDVATTYNNLGLLLKKQGNLVAARPLFEKALASREASLGLNHPDVAISLNNLGLLLWEMDEYDQSLEVHERARAIREESFGPRHHTVGTSLNNIALNYRDMGEFNRAWHLFIEAYEIWIETYGYGHPRIGTTLANMASMVGQTGRYEEAQQIAQSLVDFREQTLPANHPDIADGLLILAGLVLAQGDTDSARELTERALTIQTEVVASLLDSTSEREQLELLRSRRHILDLYLSAHQRPEDTQEAYSHVLAWKGVARSSLLRNRETLLAADDPQLNKLLQELTEIRRQIAQLAFVGDGDEAHWQNLTELTQQKEELERELARSSGDYREGRQVETADSRSVCKALPPQTVLVDIFRYLSVAPDSEPKHVYAAFVIASCSSIERIELGSSNPIDASIAYYRKKMQTPGADTSDIDAAGGPVRRAVWDQLADTIGPTSRVLIVPDAGITGLSFDGLLAEDGSYLVEEHTFGYLENAADLLRWKKPSRSSGGALLVGGLDYNANTTGRPPAAAHTHRRAECVDRSFSPLPGTELEAWSIADLLEAGQKDITVLSGAEATEAKLTELVSGQSVVHLATHGFFATGDCRSSMDATTEKEDEIIGYN